MPDHEQPIAEVPDITAALPSLLPEIRRKTVVGWSLIALSAGATIVAVLLLSGLKTSDLRVYMIPLFLGIWAIYALTKWVRRQHEALIMPMLASTAGLSYQQNAAYFAKSLPPRLLPKAGRTNAEDLVSGKFGGRNISFAEVKYETGGKNSSVLFAGIVAEFANAIAMPPFFLVSEKETKGWFIFDGKIKVDDLVHLQSLTGSGGNIYGVWGVSADADEHKGFESVLKVLINLEHAVGWGAQLYSASSDGQTMHVALSHQRNLFKIGGLMASQASLIDEIQSAYRDLTMPLTIAAQLMQAEAEVARM